MFLKLKVVIGKNIIFVLKGCIVEIKKKCVVSNTRFEWVKEDRIVFEHF